MSPVTERISGIGPKLFDFIPEPVFTLIPESCSGSSRNTVRNHPGIAFIFPRIPQGGRLGGLIDRCWVSPEGLYLRGLVRSLQSRREPRGTRSITQEPLETTANFLHSFAEPIGIFRPLLN